MLADWRDDFILMREQPDRASQRAVWKATTDDRLVRLVNGVYLPADRWSELDDRGRHLQVMRAVTVQRDRRLVFSHRSAAVAWGLPLLGALGLDAHVVASRAGGGRSDDHLVRHCVDIPLESLFIDGLEVTSLPRTIVDIARSSGFVEGLIVADAALAGVAVPGLGLRSVTKLDLAREIPGPGSRGVAFARSVVEFADHRSGSPLESTSRASMATAGLSRPRLQHEFNDADGRMIVDFWWPEWGVVGEADGRSKYEDPRFRNGRSLEQVLVDEKWREDRIRQIPEVRGFARWGAAVAHSPQRLGRLLRSAGVR